MKTSPDGKQFGDNVVNQSVAEKAIAQLTEPGLVDPQASLVQPGSSTDALLKKLGRSKPSFAFNDRQSLRVSGANGQGGRPIPAGSDYPFPAPLKLAPETLLEESDSGFKLDEKDFVFLGHQGYQFLLLRVTDSPDPPVFLLNEGREPKMLFPHFFKWLLSCAAIEIEAFKSPRRAS